LTTAAAQLTRSRWALLAGNFAIGCGVMVVSGSLNDLSHSLRVAVGVGGQLVAIAAAVMALGAPLLAALVAGFDRRRLLTFALVWYAVGHGLSALMADYAPLAVVRGATMLGAALFTPQAAAAIGTMAPPEQRGRAMTFIFLGWSLASVIGTPACSVIAETIGWRWAFVAVGALAAAAALAVWRSVPDGVRPPAMSRAVWREVVTHPVLMAIVAVTALSAAGQFTLVAYFAPYFRRVLGADPAQVGLLFLCFGAFGVVGNLALTRWIDRIGAARAVLLPLLCMCFSLLVWPLAGSVLAMALVLVPWGLGCFSSNSAQQVRLGSAAPALAPALMALNTSAIYLGQAIGSSSGGLLVDRVGFGPLPTLGLGWMLAAIALSTWAARAMTRGQAAAQVAHG
jgi:predicted MFS family arabinose efflux permease